MHVEGRPAFGQITLHTYIHVLQLCSETVAVRRRMIYDNRGRMWPKFSDIRLTVEGKPRKQLNQEIDPTGDRTRARCVRGSDVTPRPQRWSEVEGNLKAERRKLNNVSWSRDI